MQNNQNKFIASALIIIALIGGVYVYVIRGDGFEKVQTNITFPSGGETLVAGETYTLKWDSPGSIGTTTAIFLVDTALLSQGASVSIIDRKYGIIDAGSFDYTIPTGVSDSTYFFVIGTTTSNQFKITSSGE